VNRFRRSVTVPSGRIAELVGPPGAGKSSLLAALAERDAQLRAVDRWRQVAFYPEFARQAVLLLPFFAARIRHRRPLARRDMERMVRLCASRRLAASWRDRLIVMDQGPVYTLATLRFLGREADAGGSFETWWHRTLAQWADVLDTIIYLDAEPRVLMARIAGRSKQHRLKAGLGFGGSEWLVGLCRELERTVEQFEARDGVTVRRIATGARTPERIACEVGGYLDSPPSPGAGASMPRDGRTAVARGNRFFGR
jgi:predicted ATPase